MNHRAEPAGGLTAQVGQDGEYPAVLFEVRRKVEFAEDIAHMLLHGSLADQRGDARWLCWSGLRPSASTPRARAGSGGLQRVVGPASHQQLRHHLGIEHRAAAGHPFQRRQELADRRDPILEQVADRAPARSASRSSAYETSTYWLNTRMGVPFTRLRASTAALSPSSVCDGGIRTSTMDTSGRCSRSPRPATGRRRPPRRRRNRSHSRAGRGPPAGGPSPRQRRLSDGSSTLSRSDLRWAETVSAHRRRGPGRPARPVRALGDVGAADTVVATRTPSSAWPSHRHLAVAGAGMLGGIGQSLGDDEVGSVLDLRLGPAARQGSGSIARSTGTVNARRRR